MKWRNIAALFLLSGMALGKVWFLARAANVTTTVTTMPPATIVTQAHYEWYQNLDALTPTISLAPQDATTSVPAAGGEIRLRMNLGDADLPLPVGTVLKLQYATATAGPWTDLGTSTAWTFFDNPSVADGQIVVTTLLASSTVGESYGESNPSAASPLTLAAGDVGEWDWSLVNSAADTATNWFFRMVYASGTLLDTYNSYPELTAVPPSPPPPGGGGSNPPGIVAAGGGPSYTATAPSTTTTTLPVGPPLIPPAYQCLDFNGDNRIDIIDLSILLYYYGEPIPPGSPIGCLLGLTHHSTVDFIDVSILMYYWTG